MEDNSCPKGTSWASRPSTTGVQAANCTSWGPMFAWAEASSAQVLAIQEHHMHTEAQLDQAAIKLAKQGWSACWSKAQLTGRGGTSGGVAILWRRYLEVVAPPQEVIAARCIALPIRHAKIGILWLYSIYLLVGDKDGPANMDSLQLILDHASKHGNPFVLAGDFNMEPYLLQGMLARLCSPAVVQHAGCPTCLGTHPANLDYFVLHENLQMLCRKVSTCSEASTRPHIPVHLDLLGAMAATPVLVHSSPPRASVAPVCGPQLDPAGIWQDWHEVEKKAADLQGQIKLEHLFEAWSTKAYLEAAPLFAMHQPPGKTGLKAATLGALLSTRKALKAVPALAYLWCGRRLKQLGAMATLRNQHLLQQFALSCARTKVVRMLNKHLGTHAGCWLQLFALLKEIAHAGGVSGIGVFRGTIEQAIAAADTLAVAAVRMARSQGRLEWAVFLRQALLGSASVGHSLARGAGIARAPLQMAEGSSLESALLDEQVMVWSKLWKAAPSRATNCATSWAQQQRHPMDTLPPLEESHILRASASFKTRTSVIDGWHPKHMASMSKACRAALAQVFNQAEEAGDFPASQAQLVVKLLPKQAGGVRPIGLFRGLFRLWSRCRQNVARAWQAGKAKDLQQWNMLPGRQIGDACWRAMVRARCLLQAGKHCVEINWDIHKCFEHVQHHLLVSFARQLGFSLTILQISLSSYTWARHLVSPAGVCSPAIWPTQGIMAGSAFACFELCLLMCTSIQVQAQANPFATLSIHVDDFSQQAVGSSNFEAVQALANACAGLVVLFQEELGLPFAPEKATLIATSKELLDLAGNCLKQYAGTAASSVKRLGIDYQLELKPGSMVVLEARTRRVASRFKAFCRMVPKGLPFAKVFHAGFAPAGLYGMENCVVSPQATRAFRRMGMQAHRLWMAGGNLNCGRPPALCRTLVFLSWLHLFLDGAGRFGLLPAAAGKASQMMC